MKFPTELKNLDWPKTEKQVTQKEIGRINSIEPIVWRNMELVDKNAPDCNRFNPYANTMEFLVAFNYTIVSNFLYICLYDRYGVQWSDLVWLGRLHQLRRSD